MNERTPTPQEVGLPHSEWRGPQLQTFLDLRKSYHLKDYKFHFGQIPTGGGKTGVAAALGSVAPVTYVAATLGLLDQAERDYGFTPIKGKQEYNCAHPKRLEDWARRYGEVPTAGDCPIDKMSECPYSGECSYLLQRNAALMAQRSACTYRYLAVSGLMRKRVGILVLDECHEAVREIISLSSFEVNLWTINKWGLPPVPWRRAIGPRGKGDILEPRQRGEFITWAEGALDRLGYYDPKTKEGVQAKKLRGKIALQCERMQGSEWFVEGGPGVVRRFVDGKQKRVAGIILRPLSAAPVAGRLWEDKDMVLLMSATIGGDPAPLALELGLKEKEYRFHDYSHTVPAKARPIYDLGLPRMTKKNIDDNSHILVIQAIKISSFIISLPPQWRGLVLSSANYKIDILRKVLTAKLPGRIFESPEGGTTQAINAFMQNKDKGKILIGTVQGLGHGISLYGNAGRFVVLAGVPFPSPADSYTNARKKSKNGSRFLWWESYNAIPQSCGRVSRGEILDNGDYMLNVAVIADGSATSPRARKHYPKWFKPIKWNGNTILDTNK